MPDFILSYRLLQVLEILVQNPGYETVESLAMQLDTSTRTIFREMKGSNIALKKYGLRIEARPHRGVRLVGDRTALQEYLSQTRHNGIVSYAPSQRQQILKSELLRRKELEKLSYYAHIFGTSEGTISNDLVAVESWFDKHHLTIVRNSGHGICVRGAEVHLRNAMRHLATEYINVQYVETLYHVEGSASMEELIGHLPDHVLAVLDEDLLRKADDFLRRHITCLPRRMTKSLYQRLAVYLAVATGRIRAGNSVEAICGDAAMNNPYIKRMAQEWQMTFELPPSMAEAVLMYQYLKAMRLFDQTKGGATSDENDISQALADDLVAAFSERTGYDFRSSSLLRNGLIKHLHSTIGCYTSAAQLQNPFLSQIRAEYTELFSTCSAICSEVAQKHGLCFPEDEIGYIAIHFAAAVEDECARINQSVNLNVGVVCTGGIGMASFLTSVLHNTFLDAVNLIPMSADEFNEQSAELDIIVTTLDFKPYNIPVIHIGHFLQDSDLEEMRRHFDWIRQVKLRRSTPIALMTKFGYPLEIVRQVKLVQLEVNAGIHDLVRQLLHCLNLPDSKIKKYSEAVFAREKIGPVTIPHRQFLFLHSKIDHLKTPFIIFFNLRAGSGVHESLAGFDKGVLMLIDRSEKKEIRHAMSTISSGLIQDSGIIDALETGDEDTLQYTIQRYLETEIQNKESGANIISHETE